MTNYQQRKLNTFQAELAFMNDNVADFPTGSVGEKTMTALVQILTQIFALLGEQLSNSTRQHSSIKADKIQQLTEYLQMMNRAARAMADEVDGIENLFRMPRRRSNDIIVTTALTFYNDSAPYEAKFKEYDLPDTFRADIMTLITEFGTVSTAQDSAGSQKAGATGALIELFKEAGKLSNKLDAIVRNKYRNNAQKLAAWAVASHVEAAPKSNFTEETNNELPK
ncbi:MAG: hypothetical protein K1X72_28440 [Pyrinomonadaceae bacterium]|nr:hypothetical protein [Pyrinomonadaceae bacterium]